MKGGVRKRGSSWYYYFDVGTINGKRKKIEKKAGSSEAEAKKALKAALKEYSNCGDKNSIDKITVTEYIDLWFEDYCKTNCKYTTQQIYKMIINKHIKPALGSMKLIEIKPIQLQQFLNNKYKEGYSKKTLSNYFGILSKSFRMAVQPFGYLKINPMKNIKIPRYDDKSLMNEEKLRLISQDDYKKILIRFPKGHGYYIPLQIAFHTGMRSAEVCGLTWDCVDLRNGIIYVEKTLIYKDKKWTFSSPKTKSSYREIYLGDTLVKVLKEHKQMQRINKVKYGSDYITSEFVCTKENGQFITKNDLNRLSRIVNKKLNIDFTFHSLRHTHATMLLEADVPMKEIQERLGHSESSTTMDIYSHVTTNMKEDSVLKLEMINSKL